MLKLEYSYSALQFNSPQPQAKPNYVKTDRALHYPLSRSASCGGRYKA